jgi:FkbM family methyltransferase
LAAAQTVQDIPLTAMLNRFRKAYWRIRSVSQEPAPYFAKATKALALRSLRRTIDVGGVKVRLGGHCSLPLAVSMIDGLYELPERTLLQEALADHDVVLELGAGIGVVTTICAKRLGSQRVYSFEANPHLIPLAKETFALNDVAPVIENSIVGTSDGERQFYLEKDFWSSSTVKRSVRAHAVKVRVRRLSEAIRVIRPTFLIVDIEGGEAEIFDTVHLEGVSKVLIEFHPHVIGRDAVGRIRKAFQNAGFSPTKELCDGNQVLYCC